MHQYQPKKIEIPLFLIKSPHSRESNMQLNISDYMQNNQAVQIIKKKKKSREKKKMCESPSGVDISVYNYNQLRKTPKKSPLQANRGQKNGTSIEKTNHKEKRFFGDHQFKEKFKKERVKSIMSRFKTKLMRNNTNREPILYEPFGFKDLQDKSSNGFDLPMVFQILYFLVSIFFTMFFCLTATLSCVYSQLIDSTTLKSAQIAGIFWIILQIFVECFRTRYEKGQKLTKIKQIAFYYFKHSFAIDVVCTLSIIVQLLLEGQNQYIIVFLRLIFFLKLPDCFSKLNKLQSKIPNSVYMQKYWILVKIICKNFMFAHFIAIILVGMAKIQQQINWIHKMNLQNTYWFQQYCWSYYWATTIMLTVGFGDIAAANYKQAICLIFIQTFSCMVLAYNISCVGNLLNQLRICDLKKQQNTKTLKNICQKNHISSQLGHKMSSHIESSFNLNSSINFQKEKDFLQKIPNDLKSEFLIQANQKIFSQLTIFRNFTNKTIKNIAKKLEIRIASPGQKLYHHTDLAKLQILKSGQIGYFPNFHSSKYACSIIIDSLKVKYGEKLRFISFDFFIPPIVHNYDVRSKVYSMIYQLEEDILLQTIKAKDSDFEKYFMQKHKLHELQSQYQATECNFCDKKHSKFRCPKLHYIPLKEMTIFRFINRSKSCKNFRQNFVRTKVKQKNSFQIYNSCRRLTTKNDQIKDYSLTFMPQSFKQIKQSAKLSVPESQNILTSAWSVNLQKRYSHPRITVAQAMRKQMENIFYQKQFTSIWDLQTDKVSNYHYYFPENNIQKQITLFSIYESSKIHNNKSKIRLG